MTAEQARAIIAQAKADESYEGPMPEDDRKAIAEAENLIEMAQTAWAQNVRGPEVEALLRLAAVAEDDKAGEEVHVGVAMENGEIGAMGDGNAPGPDEESASNGHGEFDSSLVGIDLVKVEPWTDYSTDKVPQIIDALDAGLEGDEDPDGLLAHVWAYETAHKNRVRIIKRLEEIAAERENIVPQEVADELKEVVESAQAEPEPVDDEDDPLAVFAPAEPPAETKQHAPAALFQGTQEPEIDYSDLVEEVETQLAHERLHVPEPPTEDPPVLPYDYSKVTPGELQSLHTIFSAFAYRANYLLMRDERIASAAKMQADEIAREYLISVAKYDQKGHERKVAYVEAEVESMPRVKELRRVQRKHEIFAQAHRQERDSYSKLVEAMSRLESMRHNEWERQRR